MFKKSDKPIYAIEFSPKNILLIGLLGLGAFVFFKIWHIVASFFLAIIVAAALEPTLAWLEKKRVPRFASVPCIYLLFFGALFGMFYAVLPSVFNDVFNLSKDLPERLGTQVESVFSSGVLGNFSFLVPAIEEFFGSVEDRIANIIPDVLQFISLIFGGVFSFLMVIILSFYFSLRKNDIENALISITAEEHKERMRSLWRRTQRRLGRWLQGVFVLATFVGIAVFIMLTLLGVKFALVLGLLAGILEIIPYIGPFITGFLIFTLASTQSVVLALVAVGLYILIQQLEQAFIIPTVMSRVVGVNPLFLFLSVLVGAQLAGFWGIIIAIPLVAVIAEVIRDVYNHKAV